jgi:hypothetical protein
LWLLTGLGGMNLGAAVTLQRVVRRDVMVKALEILLLAVVLLGGLASCVTVEVKPGGSLPASTTARTSPSPMGTTAGAWRTLIAADYAPDIRKHYGGVPQNTAVGDFDGDGTQDAAAIMINDSERRYAVFVRLDSPRHRATPIVLRSSGTYRSGRDFFVNTSLVSVSPRRYITFCGRTGECGPAEAAAVNLRTDGLQSVN